MPNGFGRGAGEVGGHAFEIYKLPDLATVVDILPAICSGGPENLIL